MHGQGRPGRPVVVVDKRTRKVLKRFDSVTSAAAVYMRNCRSLHKECKEHRLGILDYYFRFEDDFDPDEDFSSHTHCPVVAIDVDTGKAKWYPTEAACADDLYVDRNAICKAIRYGYTTAEHYKIVKVGRRLAWS